MPNVPARRRQQVVAALVGVVLVCANSAVRPIDPLPTDPPKPVGKREVLPDLPQAPASPQPPGLPPLPGRGLPPLPGGMGDAVVRTQGLISLPVQEPPLPSVPTAPAAPVVPPRYVNKSDVEFDFEVTKHGRAGVKAAALWMREISRQVFFQMEAPAAELRGWKEVVTRLVKPDADAKLKWNLPYDGSFEFRLQLTGENGRKSVEFAQKTQPEMVIVLDTKPPVVKDVKLEPPANGEKHAVILWSATDANLGEKCVTLEYEQKAGGGWAKIADGAMNSGSFAWTLDDKLPVLTRVRVTVTDLAGNSTAVVSDAPTNLDSVVPEGRLTGVRAVDPPKSAEPELPGALPPPPPGAITPAK